MAPTRSRRSPPTPPPPPPACGRPATAPAAKALADPVATLIATSQRHFDNGERELKAGHLDKARESFDRAVEVLLESPYGARTEARMREHFDRLIDRVNAYEVTALAQGDGFTEKNYEAAPIDEILKNATTFPAPVADDATKAAVKADLALNPHDIPIPEHAKVLSYVEVMQGRMRDYIQESLARGAKYMPMIQTVFRAEGLPLDLAYIPIIESSFKTNALSKASAKGPWQFMKPTAKEHGLKTDWFIDERSDPEKATVAAAKYLKTLSKMFNGDWNLVLAAYNGGPGRVSRAMKRSGIDDFWRLSATTKYLPRETREYVPLIMAAMIIGRNPAAVRVRGDHRRSDRLRQGDAAARDRPAARRRMGRDDGGRDPGAQSGAAPLDHARQVSELRNEGPDGHGRAAEREARGSLPLRFLRAEVVHGEEGRDAADGRAPIRRIARRRRRSEQPDREVAPAPRPGADHPARPGDRARRPNRARRADRRRVARDRGARRRRRRAARSAHPAPRSRRSPTRSSTATRSSPSPSSSTPPSPRSRAGTGSRATASRRARS